MIFCVCHWNILTSVAHCNVALTLQMRGRKCKTLTKSDTESHTHLEHRETKTKLCVIALDSSGAATFFLKACILCAVVDTATMLKNDIYVLKNTAVFKVVCAATQKPDLKDFPRVPRSRSRTIGVSVVLT